LKTRFIQNRVFCFYKLPDQCSGILVVKLYQQHISLKN